MARKECEDKFQGDEKYIYYRRSDDGSVFVHCVSIDIAAAGNENEK